MPWFAHIADGVCFGCHGNGWILGRGQRQPTKRRQWQKVGGRIVPA
jgi:hypothetical protein